MRAEGRAHQVTGLGRRRKRRGNVDGPVAPAWIRSLVRESSDGSWIDRWPRRLEHDFVAFHARQHGERAQRWEGRDPGWPLPVPERDPILADMKRILLVSSCALVAACASAPREVNPPAPGFDAARSDPRAIVVADRVMEALGGRAAWDATRCLQWRFAGKRTHCWDRVTGDYRLDEGGRSVLMNLATGQGRVFEGGVEVLHDDDKCRDVLDRAYKVWVNDSYWLCAPYKLKDSGVRITLRGEDALEDGRPADVLRLEFAGVGVTPDNAYELWVARESGFVERWAYFKWKDDPKPTMTTPWRGWQRVGKLLFATDHGSGPATDEIVVFETPPPRLHDVARP